MDANSNSDAELVDRTLAGDHAAFGQLYDRHARMVRAVVVSVSGDWSAVDDMTQECFLRAYRKLATLHNRHSVGPWLAGFARHVARERKRTLRRDRHRFGDPDPEMVAAIDRTPAQDEQDRIERVMLRLAELPEAERLAIHAFYLEGKNANQAAEQLELSRGGFYALLQRALARLATQPKSFAATLKATPKK